MSFEMRQKKATHVVLQNRTDPIFLENKIEQRKVQSLGTQKQTLCRLGTGVKGERAAAATILSIAFLRKVKDRVRGEGSGDGAEDDKVSCRNKFLPRVVAFLHSHQPMWHHSLPL